MKQPACFSVTDRRVSKLRDDLADISQMEFSASMIATCYGKGIIYQTSQTFDNLASLRIISV